MVPYVRKSFYKHFKDGLKYVEGFNDKKIQKVLDKYKFSGALSIDCDEYKKFKNAYSYAMDSTKKESYQACEALFHNLNTLQSRSGNQLPFTSINIGTCIKPEGRIIIEDILSVCRKGLGKFHKTSIFPCVIFQCMKGVNRK
jgi:ribonucleoside-triphosphate reductase